MCYYALHFARAHECLHLTFMHYNTHTHTHTCVYILYHKTMSSYTLHVASQGQTNACVSNACVSVLSARHCVLPHEYLTAIWYKTKTHVLQNMSTEKVFSTSSMLCFHPVWWLQPPKQMALNQCSQSRSSKDKCDLGCITKTTEFRQVKCVRIRLSAYHYNQDAFLAM